jgi:hypothetical protein
MTGSIPLAPGALRLADREDLLVDVDARTGNILSLRDLSLDLTLIDQPPLWELQVNRQPIELSMFMHEDRRGILQTIGRTTEYGGYSQGWGMQVARLAVPSHHGLHLQYRVKRVPMEHNYPCPGPTTHHQEMPLWVDTLGFLGWRFGIIRPDSRMRLCHLSGGGPFEHISAEDASVAEVTPHLGNLLRRTYPGVQSIPGVLYYREDPAQWLFLLARRSKLAYTTDFNENGVQFHMQYHQLMAPLAEFPVPEISLLWGRDLAEMEHVWADQFDQYEEPPDWVYHTTWTAAMAAGNNPRKFSAVADSALASIEHGGANGLWLYTHDIKRSDTDTSPSSMGPSPNSGSYRDFREMVRRLHGAGGKVQVWVSSCGLKPWGDMRPEWALRGVDGVHWVSWGYDAHEFIVGCNPLDPGYRQYMLDWTRRYVEDFDIDGFFLDCGVFAIPCDFDPAHTQGHFPSEAGPAMRELFRDMWDITQEVKPGNFHMWYEGVHADYPGSGYCHQNFTFPPPPPGVMTGQRMLYNFVKHGPRLVWGSLQAYDLACGYAQWNPPMGGVESVEEALHYAADPMNQFICKLVRERGVRDARGLTDGLSWLDDYLVTVPDYHGRVTITEPALQDLTGAEHVLTGETLAAEPDAEGRPTLDLPGGGAYHIRR